MLDESQIRSKLEFYASKLNTRMFQEIEKQ